MSGIQVLLVAGTHGNEINPPWLFDHINLENNPLKELGINTIKIIGNPLARRINRRYIDRDLNRCFTSEFLNSSNSYEIEVLRAKELINQYGPNGKNRTQIIIDFHTTTAAMGSSLVLYGRRPADMALASLLQFRLGLPIYLHEGDKSQTGFMVESWPCGFVVEIGPVAQGLLDGNIILKTYNILEVFLEEIANIKNDKAHFPDKLLVYRHVKSLDFPRSANGQVSHFINLELQNKNWLPLDLREPLFSSIDGNNVYFDDENLSSFSPVFINEASYSEKNISMSLTHRESWNLEEVWKKSLFSLVNSS